MGMATSSPSKPGVARYEDGSPIATEHSYSPVKVTFYNLTPVTVQPVWIDFQSNFVGYGCMRPGEYIALESYHTHPWTFRAPDNPNYTEFLVVRDRHKRVVFPSLEQPDVYIEVARYLPWAPALHKSHFAQYRLFDQQVKQLLRGQYALRQHGPLAETGCRHAEAGCDGSCIGSLHSAADCTSCSASSPGLMPLACCCSFRRRRLRDSSAGCGPANTSSQSALDLSKLDPDVPMWQMLSASPAPQRTDLSGTHLGDLPTDIVLDIICFAAPVIPFILPVTQEDMEKAPQHLVGPLPVIPPAPAMPALVEDDEEEEPADGEAGEPASETEDDEEMWADAMADDDAMDPAMQGMGVEVQPPVVEAH